PYILADPLGFRSHECPDGCGRRDFLYPRRGCSYREVRCMVGILERTTREPATAHAPPPPPPPRFTRVRRGTALLNTLPPVVAIAPIIILWFGTGLLPKVLICALIVFFPVLVTWTVGLRSIDPALRDVARIYGANPGQMLRYVEIPLALRSLLGGVRIAFTLAVTGAVIGEF